MNCPINIPKGLCELCPYSKEGLCDYPYSIAMRPEEIEMVTKRGKDGSG